MAKVALPVRDRILALVETSEAGCWEWLGSRGANGYGRLTIGSRSDGSRRTALAHRVAYQEFVGPVPDGLELDHLCRNRACCNPAHLEPVTRRVNNLRGESVAAKMARQKDCKRGHPLSGDNLRINSRGARLCVTCTRAAGRRAMQRARASA